MIRPSRFRDVPASDLIKHFVRDPVERNEKILARIGNKQKILEIGPSFAPVVPKSQWNNVHTLDHASQEYLGKSILNLVSI
jgi:hypothetical protein